MMLLDSIRSSPLLIAVHSWFRGTRLSSSGPGHVIQRSGARLIRTRIEIIGEGCRLTIEPGARLWDCSISVVGRGASLQIGAGCRLRSARLCVEDEGSRLVIGNSTSMTGPTVVSAEGRLLQIGRDCMIAQFAEVRNSDSHPIFDGASGERINAAADVVIGDHAWIGLGACVLKGANVGNGAIIAARALVTGSIPPDCIAVGTPARPVRHGIRWARSR